PFFCLRIPPDPFLSFAPWLPFGIGGRAVIHHAPVRRPCPTPLQMSTGFAWRVGRAPIGQKLPYRWVDPRVDPRRAGRRAVIFELAETDTMARAIFGEKAVDLFQDLQRRRLALLTFGFVLVLVIPDDVFPTLIARQGRFLIKLLQPLAKLIAKP